MSARTRTTAAVATLCTAAVVLAGCTVTTAGLAAPIAGVVAAPELDRFYAQRLAWGPCAGYATAEEDRKAFADPKFDCARLEVPLDYAAPDGRTAQVGVLRQRATGDRVGSLLLNPGGPGGSGMSFLSSLVGELTDSPLPRRFDLIGFDPRGVGASTPTIDCLSDIEWEVERADLDVDPSPAGVEQTEAENREYAQRCTQRSGGADVLANAGTRDVVRDVDILRAALGDQQLTYVGFSYGTRIGSQYAETFPRNVRAMVLDGALDPNETSTDRTVKQSAGFQQAFEAFATDCARKPGCPLGSNPTQATAAFQALMRPLLDAPLRVGSRTLSYSDALTGAIQALYAQDYWPYLSKGIAGVARGDGRILLALADIYYSRGADGAYGNSNEAFVAIECVDEERTTDRAEVAELIRRAIEVAPFRDDGRGVVAALDPCAFWPSPPTGEPHVPQVDGLPPTLVISTTGDPATPYQAGVDLAKALRGRLVTFDGTQHTAALKGNTCVDDVVNAYLIDLTLPTGETRCTA